MASVVAVRACWKEYILATALYSHWMYVCNAHVGEIYLTDKTQGIHKLLNHCPKLTHLSLTGVQAFLRDELLAFCREAPPEFNDHQRDVFCVFSGTGVARLREFLNEQKAHAEAHAANRSATPSVTNSDHGVEIDDSGDSEGSNTPIMNIDVHGNHPAGATPIISGPSAGSVYAHGQPAWQLNIPPHGVGTHSLNLSQSAPATTGSVPWAGPPPPHHGAPAGAQHVTGMMGATILDDVDEGDEAFGEGSEIMD